MIIGLTGGLGCGKSTASKIFAQLGFKTLDCDTLVEEIYATVPSVYATIKEHFGQEVLNQEGAVDKKLLAQKVFHDKKALAWLEDLILPKVQQLQEKYIAQDPNSNWIVEIPLLFEKNLETEFDITICLSAQLDVQLSRLVEKGMSLQDAKARIACQMPLYQKETQADYTIHNNGTIDSLRKQIYSFLETLNINL